MSLRRKILLAILAPLLLVPTGVLYFIVTTERGLQFIASHLGKLGPVTVTASGVSGTLADGFKVESLRIQHRLSDVQIDHATGRLELLPVLILQRITLPEVKIDHVSVIALRDPVDRPPQDPHFLPTLLRIDADTVRVESADITLLNGRQLHVTSIDGKVTVLPKQIRIRAAQLDYDLAHVVASGRILAASPLGLEGEAETTYRPVGLPQWQVTAKFDGDLDKLPLTAQIEKPFHARIEGAATTLKAAWQFAGRAHVRDFDIVPFGGGKVLGIIAGDLDLTANSEGFSANGSLTPPGLKAGAFQVDFHGAYGNKHLTIKQATVVHAPSGARATVQGGVDIIKGGPQLELRGDWTRFRWPLLGITPAFTSPRGHYTLSGVKPWAVQAEGDVITADLPAMPATLRGALAGDALRIDAATAKLLGGIANVTGEARWQPGESWRVAGRMTGMDPTTLRADLPGMLNFDFKASGAPFGEAGNIDFEASKLAGKLRSQNVSGKGKFTRAANSRDWKFSGVDVRLGRTRVQLDGGFGVRSDLRFAIDADDLSLFDPEARGRLSARGRYAGTRDAPVLLFKARGTGFEWQGSKLGVLDADVDMDLGPNGHAQGQIDIGQLDLGSRTIQSASVALTGNGEQQHLAFTINATPMRLALGAQGSMRDGLWQGTVQNLLVDDSHDLRLRLEAPATLAINLQQIDIRQLCLKGGQERMCGGGRRLPDGSWNLELAAESLPLRTLTAGLTQDIDYDGTINLQANVAGTRDGLPTGTIRGQLQQALLRHALSNGREESMALGTGTVTASATASGFEVQVGLDAGASGNIKGELTGERNSGQWREFPIRGSLEASTDALSLLDIYFGGIDKATGRIITRVGIAGTLGAPTLQGMLQLRDASIDIYQVNLGLRELTLDATFDNNALDITGQSKLGNGMAKFNGKLAWKGREPYGDLHIEGENLRVVDVPEARIEASPKLDFKITGHRIDATGEVRVPFARIAPADLANVVLPSSDEVMVGAPVVDPSQRWLVVSNIRVVLGNQVHLDTLGLKASLGGTITVRTDESQISRGQGELNITEGKYAALGRLLDIERGRLIFNNVPLGDPGIDMRAQKVYPDITAGVNVRGSLRAPRLTFFSEPAIPQSQIASLIIAGGSLESVQNSTASGAARNDLLAQGTAILAQRVGSRVGIDDVGIESNLSNDTSLVLGKYLSPRLYVSYGISLAEAINTVKMRFTLGDRWTIKTEAGKARSADIVYTIQK